MKTMIGTEIKVGDIIAYTTKYSSSIKTHIARINYVGDYFIRVYVYRLKWDGSRDCYYTILTSNKTIVHVSGLTEEIIKVLYKES